MAARLNTTSHLAIAVPMDGYHLTRAALSALPDPSNAHARRGAAFTFDAEAFYSLILSLRSPVPPLPSQPTPQSTSPGGKEGTRGQEGELSEDGTVYAPSFDHAVKDPKQNDIAILRTHKVVLIEGNYTALNKPTWSSAASLFDELWFVDVPFDVARRRLVGRHVAAGIAADEEEAGRRADENDLVNGREIVENMVPVNEVVHSLPDEDWV